MRRGFIDRNPPRSKRWIRHDYHFYASNREHRWGSPVIHRRWPIVEDINLNAGVSVFGPGNRANATIGRAIRLIIMNVFEMIPGLSDLSTQGSPRQIRLLYR